MFSSKPSVNLIAQLMCQHGVTHVVVCPGSRNAPLLNDFYELSLRHQMTLYPVTDERSAAFVAIGIYLATRQPAAVCVTSGTALLNTLPAVAEAYYRHAPLLVISADRPPQHIDQLRGQTIHQVGALQPYTPTFQIPEQGGAEAVRKCNDALLALRRNGGQPSHINVPLTEPIHVYDKPELTALPMPIVEPATPHPAPISPELMAFIAKAEMPAVVVGHMDFAPEESLARLVDERKCIVISEFIGSRETRLDSVQNIDSYLSHSPDVFIHIGGSLIQRRHPLLQKAQDVPVIRIEPSSDQMPEAFGTLRAVVRCTAEEALAQLLSLPTKPAVELAYGSDMEDAKETTGFHNISYPKLMHIFFTFCEKIEQTTKPFAIHSANSLTLRLVNQMFGIIKSKHKVFCNRGVNGIDGSLSVAAGHSLATDQIVYIITGDLSFFYDSNALWNEKLRSNLRILLFNDGGGEIFNHIDGTASHPAHAMIAGEHRATAKGICQSYDLNYLSTKANADNAQQYAAVEALVNGKFYTDRPVVLECFL
ncbi:MAG: 2-succinyl-5-enolpyruvyl-6-hydroxy-3-cyclohexene-1-carboxylic-acid synthase [Bacteroidaceae bacterium]|nr:2-succinyl-5-enolpyruvyl-6-hydroxy-3-cyclohexene-1-carboxylic-acid synthase [Bacteroidaceae bacterium]